MRGQLLSPTSCLQVISTEEAIGRANFYAEHNIAFVARPPLFRRGVFKKASNLNYQLAVSGRIVAWLAEHPEATTEAALLAIWEEKGKEFVAAGDLSMDEGCLILLIDADTRVRTLPSYRFDYASNSHGVAGNLQLRK